MNKRNQPNYAVSAANAAEKASATWLYVLLTIVCAAFLAVGFFFAARQHFASMDLSMKNSELRKQLEEMEAQNRQLVLAREIVRSPGEVKKTAISRGFREKGDEMAAVTASVNVKTANPMVEKTSLVKPAAAAATERKPVKAFLPQDKKAAASKSSKPEKRSAKFPDAVAVSRVR